MHRRLENVALPVVLSSSNSVEATTVCSELAASWAYRTMEMATMDLVALHQQQQQLRQLPSQHVLWSFPYSPSYSLYYRFVRFLNIILHVPFAQPTKKEISEKQMKRIKLSIRSIHHDSDDRVHINIRFYCILIVQNECGGKTRAKRLSLKRYSQFKQLKRLFQLKMTLSCCWEQQCQQLIEAFNIVKSCYTLRLCES